MKYTMHTHIAATKEAVMKTEMAYYADSYLKEQIFSKITKNELQRIEDWVNNYPRKIFKFKSANEMYCEAM